MLEALRSSGISPRRSASSNAQKLLKECGRLQGI